MLISELSRLGLRAPSGARAQRNTIRLELLKIGAQIQVCGRCVWVMLSSAYPYPVEFIEAFNNPRRLSPAAGLSATAWTSTKRTLPGRRALGSLTLQLVQVPG